MIHARHTDTNRIVGLVTPAVGIQGMEESQEAIERRIALSFNILGSVPLVVLEGFDQTPQPLDSLARWLDQQRKTTPH